MATEADIPEPASLLEKGVNRYLTPGEFNQPPETADYFVKSGNMEVASNVEILDSGFKGNAGMTAGESFFESPSITKVPGEETSRKQETCQADDIPYQAEKEMVENEKQILEDENSKTAEETGSKENEHVGKTEEISEKGSNEISDSTGIHLKREKVEELGLKVREEETSREEKLSDHIEAYSIKENPKIIEKETSGLQNDEEDKDAELTTSKEAMILEASSDQNGAASIHTPELTVHNLDANVLKIENKDKVSSTEISPIEENNEQKNSGVEEKEANCCSSFLDEEKGPDVANTIEKIEGEKGGIGGDANEQASTILAASIDIQNDREANSAITENVENKLDSPSVSSIEEAGLKVGDKLEDTSIIASKEESQDTINLNENMQDVTLFMNETQKNHADTPSVTQTEEMCLQKVDKTEISKAVIGTWSEDVVERSPQGRGHIEILEKTAQADSSEGEKVKDEMASEQKLDSLNVRHEEGKQNIAEEPAVTEASAGESKDDDGHAIVASEHIINDAVTAAEHSKGELGNEKIKTSLEMVSEETSATASSDCSQTITCAKDDRSTENNEECFDKKKKEEKSIAIDTSCDDAIPREENLPPTEPTEKIEIQEVEIPNKDVDELNATHSLEQGTVVVKGAELQEVSGFEPQDQVAEKEKSVDIDAIKDDGITTEENLSSTELNEKIQIEKIETQNKNGDELNVTHSLKPETTLLQHEELPEVSFFGPKNQVNEAEKLVGINAIEDDGIPKNLQPTESIEKIEISEVKIPNKNVDELNGTHSLEQETVLAQGEVLGEVSNFEPQNQVNEEEKSIDIDAVKDDGISKEKNLHPTEPNEKIETVEVDQNKKVDDLNATHSFEREAEIVQHEELREISNLEPQSQINEEEKLIDIDAIKDDGIQKVESLPPTEPSEKIQISEVQFPNKNVDELNVTPSSEEETVLAQGEVPQEVSAFESREQVNEEEESVDIDAVKDDGIPRDKNLPPEEPIGTGEDEIEDNNVDALNATLSLEQDTKLVQGEELREVSNLEPQDQVNEEEKSNLPPIEPSENIHISEVEIPNKNIDELNATHSLEQETVLAQDEVLQEVPAFEPEEQVNEEEKSQDIDVIKDDGIPKDENLSPAALNEKIGTEKAEIQDKSIDELNATPSLEQETELVQGEELREVSNLEPQDQIMEEEKLVNSNAIKDDEIPRVENQPPIEPSENIHISEVEIPNKNVDELNATPSWEQETVQTQGEVSREVSDFEPQGQVKEEEKSLNIYAVKDDEISKEENLLPAEPNEKIGTIEAEIQDKDVDELNATPSLEQDAKLVQGEELPEVSNLEPQDQVNEGEKLNLPPIEEPNENIHISEVEVPNKNLDELNATNSLEQETVLAQGEVLREVSDFEPQEQVQEEEKSLDIDAIKDDGIPKENLSPAEQNEKIKKTETEIQDKNVDELNATPLLEQDPKLVQGEDLQEVLNFEPQGQVKEEEKSVDSDAINEDGIPKVENLPPTEPSENIHVSEVDIPNKNVDELNATHSWEQETVQTQREVSQEVSDFEPQGQVKEEEKSLNIDVVKDHEIPKENLSLLDELNATPSLEGYAKLVQGEELREVSDLEPQDQVHEEEKSVGIDAIKDDGIPKIENLTPTKPSEKTEIAEVETPNTNVDELNVTHTLEQETILAQGEVLQEISDFEPQELVNEEQISVEIDAVKDDGTPKEENLPPADPNEKIKGAQVEIQNKNTDESNAHSLKQETALMQSEELQEVSNREPQDQVNEEEKSVVIDVIKDNGIPKVENLSPTEPSEKIEIAEVEIQNNYADELDVTQPLEPKMVPAQGEVSQEVSEFEAQEQVNEEKSIDIDVVKEDGIPKEENLPPTSPNEIIEIEKVEIQKNVDELNVAHSVEQEIILVQGEELREVSNFEPEDQVNEEEKSVDIDPIKDHGIPKVENLPPIEPNDKIEVAEVEIPNKNVDELNVSHLLEQEPVLTQVELLQEVFDFEPQDQVNEANAATRDGEKHDENNLQACESTKNNSELPLAKREVITELSLETCENEIEKLEKVHKSNSEAKFEIKEVEMSREEDIQKEEACETEMHKLETSDGTEKSDTEEAASDKVCGETFLHETVEQNFEAASLQKEETTLKDGEDDEKITSIVNEKTTSIGEVSDEQNTKDRVEHLSTEVINEETTESSEQIEKEVEISKEEDTRGPIIGGNGNESISQKTVEEGPVKNFQDEEKNIDMSNSREITTGTVNSITNEEKQNDENTNSILQCSLVKEQENLQSEASLAEEIYGDESPVNKDEYKENYTGLAEVEEHNEEILKSEKNLEQICQKNEAVENIEQPLNLISAEIDESASSGTDDKTVEERVESPKDNEREAEMAKEEIIQETNIKSLSQESIAQDSGKNNQNDDNSAEKSNTEIFEESKAAGTGEEHETNQNDTSETIPTSLVKEVESLENEGKNIVVQASLEEKMEDGSSVKVVEDNDNNTRLEEDNKDSDMEESKIADSFSPEMNQTDESLSSALQASLVREQECLQSVTPTPPEPSPMDEKDENDSIKTDEENKEQSEEEKLKDEEDLEQILQKSEPRENLEQPITVLSAKTEAGALSEVAKNLEEEIVDIHQNNAKDPEIPKEEDGAKEHIIYEQGIVKNFRNDEVNFEICNKEICVESMTNKTCQSIPIETSQNNESHNAPHPTAPMQEEESLQGKGKDTNPAEALTEEKKEDNGSAVKAHKDEDNNTELSEVINNSEKDTSQGGENIELELQKNEPEELEKSSNMITAETEAGMLRDKANDIIIIKEVEAIQNAGETVEKENNEERNEDIESEVKKVPTTEDLKPDAETSDVNIGVESELLEAKSITSERQAEIIEKTHGLDSVEKLEGKHTSENTEEEIKKEDIEEVCSDIATACSSEATEKDTTVEALTTTDISPQSTGEETALIYREDKEEEKPNMEMQELELSSIVKETEKQVPEEVNILRDQYTEPAIVIADDVTVVMPQKEMHKIIQSAKEDEDVGKQITEEGSAVEENSEVHVRGIDEEDPLQKQKEDESDTIKLKEEIKGFDSESTEEIAASSYEVKEDNRQLESFGPETHDKEPVTGDTKETTLDSVDIGALRDDASNLVEMRYHEISAEADEAEEEVKHELQNEALIAGSNDQNKVIISETASGKILDVNLMECAKMSSKDSELITNEESQPIDESSAEHPTEDGNIEIAQISQATEPMHDEDKITIKEGVSELDSVDTGIESGSSQSEDLHQDLELHNEQIISKTEDAKVLKTEETRDPVDQGDTYKSKISEDEEPSNVGDEYFKCIETINADRKEAIQEEEDSAQKPEASLEKDDAVEKEAAELEAGYQKQGLEDSETKSNGIHTEQNFESAESSKKPSSETLTRDQSNETLLETNPKTVEENRTAESVEQRSQESQENQQEMEEKTEPKLEVEDKLEETQNADETIRATILTEKVCKENEKHDDDEIVKHFNKEENDMKELHTVSTEDGGVDEVKESSPVSTEYLKATDSNEETEIESSEVQAAQTLEKETLTAKENEERKVKDEGSEKIVGLSAIVPTKESEEIVKEEIIEDADSCYNKIKAITVTEITAEPSLEEALRDDKQEQDSNIPSDKSSPHADKPEASQQGSVALEENTFVYESKSYGMEDLQTGEVREEIREDSEIVHRSRADETVSETEVARDQTLREERAKEHETPSLSMPCKEEDYGTEATIDNVEENMEKVIITKGETVENSSALKTAEDICLQKENSRKLEVLQPGLQVRESMPDSSNEEHEEKEETLDETEEVKKAAETASKSSTEHKVADDQTLPEEKSEEQHQTESVALLSKEHELGSTTKIEKMAENIKEVELLEDEPKTNEEVCLQKEASEELKVFQLDLELNKDTEESPKEAPKVASGTSVEIDEKKEAFECKSMCSSEDKGVAKEDGTSSVQTNPVEKSEEQNPLLFSALLSKEQEVGMSAKIESIEENKEEMEVLEDKSKVMEEVFHQNEDSRELEVSLLEFQIDNDAQNEIHKREDGNIDGTEEKIKEVSELALKSSSQVNIAVADDEITSNQPLPTEKSEEENQTSPVVLLSKDQEVGTSTTSESIKENTINVEVPENAPKTVEEASMQKGESRELNPSQLELQLDTDIRESPEEVHHEAEDGTLDEPLKLQHQHDHEMGDAECPQESGKISEITGPFEKTSNLKTETNEEASESLSEVHGHEVLIETEETGIKEEHLEAATMALMAEENQSEETTNATENMHDEVMNEQIMEEKDDAKNFQEMILGEEATKESHQEHKILAKEIQNEAISTEKGTVENLYQAVVDNISSEEATKEIHQEHEIKSEESVGDKLSVKEIQNEAVCKEMENASASETIEKQISIEKGTVESLHQAIVDNISCEEATKEIHQEHEIKDEEILGDKMLAREIQPEEKCKGIENADASEIIAKQISIEKVTVESLHQDVVDKISSEEVTKEIHQDHEIKDEEILGDKILAKEIQPEELCKEIENADASETIAKRISIEKETVESPHRDVFYNISSEQATQEIYQEHEKKNEEILGDKELARELQTEELCKEIENTDGSVTTAKQISTEKETDENLYQVVENETITEHFPDETGGENLDKAGARINIKNKGDETISGDGGTEATIATEKDLVVETSQKEGAIHPAETTPGIHQEEKTSDGTLENQISREVEPEKMISTGKKDAPQVQQEPIVATTQVTEEEDSQPAYATVVTPEVKRLEHGAENIVDEKDGKAIQETTSKDSAKISLFHMMQRSTRERQVARELTEEKGPMASKEEMKVEKQTEKQTEKAKSDEEVEEEEEEGDEQKKNDSGSDAPVIVEASRDIDIKVVHKKSHNILSGVGSKVKHSISKVKKAITGKSSHPKQHSPK